MIGSSFKRSLNPFFFFFEPDPFSDKQALRICSISDFHFLSEWSQYYNLNGKLPHITYEYTVPFASREHGDADDITTGPVHSQELSEDLGEEQRLTNHSRQFNIKLVSDHQSNVRPQEEEEPEGDVVMWEFRTPSPAPPAAMLVYRPADITSRIFSHNDVEKPGPPAPVNYSKYLGNIGRNEWHSAVQVMSRLFGILWSESVSA